MTFLPYKKVEINLAEIKQHTNFTIQKTAMKPTDKSTTNKPAYSIVHQMIILFGGGNLPPKIINYFQNLLNRFYTPIKQELIFFILTFLLLSPAPVTSIVIHFGELGCVRGTITGLCGGIAWSYIATLIASLIHITPIRKIYKGIIYTFNIILIITYFTLRYGFGRFITPAELSIIISTTPEEIQEFFTSFFSFSYVVWITAGLLLFAFIIISKKHLQQTILNIIRSTPHKHRQLAKIIFIICTLYGFYDLHYIVKLFSYKSIEYIGEWPYWRIDDHYGDNLSKLIYSSICVKLSYSQINHWDIINHNAYNTNVSTSARKDLKIILVIGESFIRSHSSLYGYPLETNPRLREETVNGHLAIFTDAVTPANSTIDVMHNILCTNDTHHDEMWYDSPFFPLLFTKAGWEVNYWDNQTEHTGDFLIFNFSLMEFLFNDFLLDNCYSNIYEHHYQYDEDIVSDYIQNVPQNSENSLTIFHLYGQHIDAASRYPANSTFSKFNGFEIDRKEPWMTDEKRQAIAHYDNATYYNDFVVKKIIDIFRNDNAIVIYFSDHGEEIYDYRDSFGRKACPENLKKQLLCQNSVPFVIWMSDKFKDYQPSVAQAIKEATDRPIITYDIPNFIMGLAEMDTPYYKSDKDLVSQDYHIGPRIVMKGLNYDEITK